MDCGKNVTWDGAPWANQKHDPTTKQCHDATSFNSSWARIQNSNWKVMNFAKEQFQNLGEGGRYGAVTNHCDRSARS